MLRSEYSTALNFISNPQGVSIEAFIKRFGRKSGVTLLYELENMKMVIVQRETITLSPIGFNSLSIR